MVYMRQVCGITNGQQVRSKTDDWSYSDLDLYLYYQNYILTVTLVQLESISRYIYNGKNKMPIGY